MSDLYAQLGITVHNDNQCRRCVDCEGERHHWIEDGGEDWGEDFMPHLESPVAMVPELVWFQCRHCPAWITCEDFWRLEEEMEDA